MTQSCDAAQTAYTFAGMVGTVTAVPPKGDIGEESIYSVTFNDGRSSYEFRKADLILDNPSYNYEVRTLSLHHITGPKSIF
jgi:hypothetical protein